MRCCKIPDRFQSHITKNPLDIFFILTSCQHSVLTSLQYHSHLNLNPAAYILQINSTSWATCSQKVNTTYPQPPANAIQRYTISGQHCSQPFDYHGQLQVCVCIRLSQKLPACVSLKLRFTCCWSWGSRVCSLFNQASPSAVKMCCKIALKQACKEANHSFKKILHL